MSNGQVQVGNLPSGGGIVSGGATLNASQLPHTVAAIARVKINAGNCRVYCIGDSTTAGAYALNVGDTGDVFAASYPTRLSQYLNNTILPAQRDSFMGDGAGAAAVVGVNDARVTMGSWVQGDINSTGGASFKATAGATPLTFLPLDSVDTFRVWYVTNPGLGSFSYGVDAGAPTTVSENSASSVISVVVAAGSLASHTLKLTWISGGVHVLGVEAYNSTVGSVQIVNAGWVGATAVSWAASSPVWAPLPAVATQAPDLILLSLGINDWENGEGVPTYTANMQALITAWKPQSDIVLVTPAPSSIAGPSLATQQQYVTALYSLAAANNIPIIDNFARWGSYELKNPAPFLFYNHPFHPSANGYSDFAQSIATQLLSVVGH